MLDADSLLRRVKAVGHLTKREFRDVRSLLRSPVPREDPYTPLHVLWQGKDRESEAIFRMWSERHISEDGDDDGLCRRIALQALGDLHRDEHTFDAARRALISDPSKYVRMAAASILGALGHEIPAVRSLAATTLLDRFRTSQDIEREACYSGLLNLGGVSPRDRPLATRPLEVEDIDPAVIRYAEHLSTQ